MTRRRGVLSRRGFMRRIAAVLVAVSVDPLLGGQSIWGTDPIRPSGMTREQWALKNGTLYYAPYIPVQRLDILVARPGARKGYAGKKFREDYYGRVTIG